MKLGELERAMLAGEHGPAVRQAIEHQVKVGEFFGAPDFVPVTQAHVMADTFDRRDVIFSDLFSHFTNMDVNSASEDIHVGTPDILQ